MVRAGDSSKLEDFRVTKSGDVIQSLGIDASIGTTGHYYSGSIIAGASATLNNLIDGAIYMLELAISTTGSFDLFFPSTTGNNIRSRRQANTSFNMIFKNVVANMKITMGTAACEYTLIRIF